MKLNLLVFSFLILLGACKQQANVVPSNQLFCKQELTNLEKEPVSYPDSGVKINANCQSIKPLSEGIKKQDYLCKPGIQAYISGSGNKFMYPKVPQSFIKQERSDKPISDPNENKPRPGRTLRIAGPLMVIGSLIITIIVVSNIFLPGDWPWIFGVPMGIVFILGWIFWFVGIILLIKTRDDTRHQNLRLKWSGYFFRASLALIFVGMLSLIIVWSHPWSPMLLTVFPLATIGGLAFTLAFFLLISAWIMYARYRANNR